MPRLNLEQNNDNRTPVERPASQLMRMRRIFGYGAAIAVTPYLLIKIAWTFGLFVPTEQMDDASWRAINAVTAVIAIVGILLAMAFCRPWGERLPAWLVALPVWVGTGAWALAGAWGLLVLTSRRGSRRFLPPMAAAWISSGMLFSYNLFNHLSAIRADARPTPEYPLAQVLTTEAGIVLGVMMGMIILLVLHDRRRALRGAA